jgi:hypothetical protein
VAKKKESPGKAFAANQSEDGMKRQIVWIVVVALTLSGCAARQKTVTNLPPGVTQTQVQNWDSAVANLDKIAQTVSTLRQAVITLNQTTVTDASGTHKILPDGSPYITTLTAIGKIDQAEIDASNFLKAQPQNWGVDAQTKVKNEMAIIQQEIAAINAQGLTGIRNAGAQQQVQQLVNNLSSLAALILSLTT